MSTNGSKDFVNWDLTSYFPTFDGPEFKAHRDRLEADLIKLGEDATKLAEIREDNAAAWAELFLRDEALSADFSHLASYVGCLVSGDSRNEAYRREQARLASLGAVYQKANVPFAAALRTVSDAAFAKLVGHPQLATARYPIERARTEARWSMDPALEILTADLNVDGIGAWGRLYDNVAGKLEFDMTFPDGRKERVPMAQKRSLLDDPDPRIRKEAMIQSNKAWEAVEESVAACLNGIAGTRLTLNRHRKIPHFLDVAMFQSGVEERTIEQMWSVVARNREVAWKFLRRKAEILGVKKLGFQDIGAPLPLEDSARFSWADGVKLTLDSFRSFYPALADFTQMMLDERRVESEKRAGKRPGAFCTSSVKTRESRVYMTYGGSVTDVQTFAHEIGHAFHNHVMRDMRPLVRHYPMTLAETASTFAENILASALIAHPTTSDAMRAQLLASKLNHAVAFMCDIHMRYIFEKNFYTERAKGEVSVSRLKELMLDAQRECFGDTLDENQMDPYFWASKLHFYITGVTFYNFPYTFGFLFSQGLFTLAQMEGPSFLPKYEALLRLTGSDTAEGVAKRSIGVDLALSDFWQAAVENVEDDIAKLETLLPSVLGAAH